MSEPLSVNLIGRISHFFTVNRALSWLLLVSVLFFGLFSFWLTPKQYNPEIIRPAFVITLQYEDATIAGATDRLVYELVEKIRTVPGVEDITTEVHDGAQVNTTVIFEVGYDATTAKLDLLSQLEQHQYSRPDRVSFPEIREINPETIPVLQIAFGSDSLSIPETRARVVALGQALGEVDAVSEVSVHGGYAPALVVELDPSRLAAANVTIDEVVQALQGAQRRIALPGVTSGAYRIPVIFDAQRMTPGEIGALPVRETVRVHDVATVFTGYSGDRSLVTHASALGSGEVVLLAVSKREGSSAPEVTRDVRERIEALVGTPGQYAELDFRVIADDGVTASREVYGLTENLLTSVAIVTLVLMLFLSIRAALVVLIAIPLTLLIVFGLGLLFEQTINRITLFALILSLGLLVDSAIVVVENIHTHLQAWRAQGATRPREHVVAQAVHEIGAGLVLSTITSVIVFLPMGYITGMMGPYMGPIAFFVPAALMVSLLVAIVITPFIAAWLIDGGEGANRVSAICSRVMSAVTKRYVTFLRAVLKNRVWQRWMLRGMLGLFLIALVWPLVGLVHFQMLPKADLDQFYLYLDLPVDASVASTRSAVDAVTAVLLRDTDVTQVHAFVGEAPITDFNGMFKGAQYRNGAHQATLRVNLRVSDERSRSSTEIVNELRSRVSTQLPTVANAVRFMEEPPGPPVRATFEAKVFSPDPSVRERVAQQLEDAVGAVSGTVDIERSTDIPVSRVRYVFDHEAAAAQQVSLESVESAFAVITGPLTVAEFSVTDAGEFVPMMVGLPAWSSTTPAVIDGVQVRTGSGRLVPLSSVVRTETVEHPNAVTLEGVSLVTYVTAEVENRPIVYVMIDLIEMLVRGEVEGVSVSQWGLFGMSVVDDVTGETVRIAWGGEWEMTLENFRDLGIAMGVALLLVYAVLVAQYGRFSTPAYILVTVPLGLVGILFGFLMLDQLFSIHLTATALIGFIALIGIVVNNAIIYLEYVEQAAGSGRSFANALIEAGAARLRPIVLTSLTTVLGSLTIASDPVWSGLAWAIVFGLSLSTVLTLIVYPVLLMYYTGHTRE